MSETKVTKKIKNKIKISQNIKTKKVVVICLARVLSIPKNIDNIRKNKR